jgi:hypothetical protein
LQCAGIAGADAPSVANVAVDEQRLIGKTYELPMHLVHPEHGKFMVFDIYGMAVCPSCAAIWYRDHKGTVLLKERKPPKRATPMLFTEEESSGAVKVDNSIVSRDRLYDFRANDQTPRDANQNRGELPSLIHTLTRPLRVLPLMDQPLRLRRLPLLLQTG